MDPRLRERRVAVIRAQGRRRLRVLIAVVGLLVILGAAGAVAFSPVLDVDRVDVEGVGGARADEARTAAGIEIGDPILLVDTGAAAGALEALPWVDDARVERDLPGSVRISVTRRILVGWAPVGDGGTSVALVDSHGRVLGTAVSAPPEVPEIVGVERVPDIGASIEPTTAAEVLGELPAALLARAASIRLDGESATLVLDDGPEVRLGEATELATKGRVALAVLDALDAAVTYVDVQVPSVPVTG